MLKKTLLLLALLLLPSTVFAQHNILALHSYHRGYEWTHTVQVFMENFLVRVLPEAELFLEAMDTKSHDPERSSLAAGSLTIQDPHRDNRQQQGKLLLAGALAASFAFLALGFGVAFN